MADRKQPTLELFQPEPEPWMRVHTVEASVSVALGLLVIALGFLSEYRALLPTVGLFATGLAIFAAKDRDRTLIKWAIGVAVVGVLLLFLSAAQSSSGPQEDQVEVTVDAIVARDFPDGLGSFCERLSKLSDAQLSTARSRWIQDNSGNQPPPGLVWDELVTRC